MNDKQDKVILFMKSLLPMLVAIIFQFGVSFLAELVVSIKVNIDFAKVANTPGQNPDLVSGVAFKEAIARRIQETMSGEPFFSTLTLILFLFMAVFFMFWFFAGGFTREQTSVKEALPLHNIGIILISGVLIQLGVTMLLNVILPMFPRIESEYAQLLETLVPESDMISVKIMTAFSVGLLAPIAEELIFRGISLGNTRKFWPFIPAVIFQALLFGIYHFNWVQGVYAFLIGLLLGYLAYKLNNILASILLHMAINSSSLILEYMVPPAAVQTNSMALFLGIVSLIAALALFVLLKLPEPVDYSYADSAKIIAEKINASYMPYPTNDNPLSRVDFSAPVRTPDVIGEVEYDTSSSAGQSDKNEKSSQEVIDNFEKEAENIENNQ